MILQLGFRSALPLLLPLAFCAREFISGDSYFEANVKYLWLLFDLAAGPDNIVENGPYKYIFSTEGHLLPATPEISLAD
ncbi:hypothetical protein MRB53_003436 [Persea americana]|uniref:Uncharacterized protein n=1 Tax=Persea americana TaxID=3435 RepID=A0ACC2MY84_PERAE|nr:hypothetical protein MRB53_003436 [Persea americana]